MDIENVVIGLERFVRLYADDLTRLELRVINDFIVNFRLMIERFSDEGEI